MGGLTSYSMDHRQYWLLTDVLCSHKMVSHQSTAVCLLEWLSFTYLVDFEARYIIVKGYIVWLFFYIYRHSNKQHINIYYSILDMMYLCYNELVESL